MSDEKYVDGLATVWPEDEKQPPVQAYFNKPKNKNYGIHWINIWQDSSEIGVSMTEQAKSDYLTRTEYRVRDWLLGTIGIGNYVYVNQSEVARQLNIDRANVSKAIKHLIDLDILLSGPKSGKSNTYMVNPAFCFSGQLKTGVKARKQTIKARKARVLQFNHQEE